MLKNSMDDLKRMCSNLSGVSAAEINERTALVEDLQLSSLKFVELIAIIGEEYGVAIDEDKAMNLQTVGDLYCLLKSACGKQA